MTEDTIELLKECNAGVKTAVEAIDEVLPRVHSEKLRALLEESHATHEELGNRTRKQLESCAEEGKEPNPIAKSMTWMKTNVKLTLDESDATVADLMMDGCGMGIKSLCRYLNQYKGAEQFARELANELVEAEHTLMLGMRSYL